MRKRLHKTFIIVIISLCFLSIMIGALAQSDKNGAGVPPSESTKKYTGVCYGPFRDNEAPGYYPTLEELQEDINFISTLANSTRTYSVAGTLSEVPHFCQDAGIDCYPGAWISKQKGNNEREVQSLIQVANQNLSCIKGLIVGNEVLLRDDVTEDELIEYITQVKNNTTVPVSTAEIWGTWLEHPQLAENVDFIIIHIHPYWEGGTYYGESHVGREGISASNASEHVIEKWKEVKARYPHKEVIIGETGWPTQGETIGDAIPSEENQRIFLSDFLMAAEENNTRYFYFDVFDEHYKECSDEANVAEGHWGIYYSNGSLKPLLKNLVPEEAREGFYRPPRDRKVPLPWFVYKDAWSPENHFIPSGWMGDLIEWAGDPLLVFDDACTDAPYAGDTCVKLTYVPGSEEWGGIYWQFPENNWGKCPGYDLSGATKLTFWAKGAKGGEKAEFKTGGINRHAYNVYTDKNAANNHYFPSGWYNGASNMLFDDKWMNNPHSGTSCIKVTWNGARGNDGTKWNGIMWQNPEGNWIGDSGHGYNLTDATKLTFWARTDEPGLKVKFLIGYPDDTSGEVSGGWRELYPNWTEYEINLSGRNLSDIAGGFAFLFNDVNDPNPDGCIFYLDDIKYDKVALNDTDKPYQDSYGPVSSELVTLTNNWTQYAITLADDNLTHVIGGFCWVATQKENPDGCTIYIDEISFVEPPPIPKIIGVDPVEPVANTTKQWITIFGTGFVPDSTVILRIGSDIYPIPSDHTDYRNSTEIRVYATLADPGTWTVQITNPEDRQSNIFNFTVVPPDLTITSVAVTALTTNSAIITWKTDKISDSLVKYGTTPGAYTMQANDSTDVMSHNVGLSGLDPETTYFFVVNSTDPSGNSNESSEYNFTTLVVPDTTPPASISNLQNETGATWINWTWENPPDADFDHVMVYVDGVWKTNTSDQFYSVTALAPETAYELGTHTVDQVGNINETWMNQTTKTTAAVTDTTPPETTITAGPSGTINYNDVTFTWTGTDDVSATSNLEYQYKMGDTWSGWVSSTSVTYTGLSNGDYTFTVRAKDEAENEDQTPATRSFTVSVTYRRSSGGGGGGGTSLDSDGDGYFDTVEIMIGTDPNDPNDYPNKEAATPTPTTKTTLLSTTALSTITTPTPTVTPTVPAPETTPEPATPIPEEPGFEAIFAVAGLLAIAYVILRRRG